MANPAITVEFLADTAKLTKGLNKAEGASKGFGSKLGGLAKTGALAAGAAGIGALVATVKIGIDEFAQAQKVAAQTNAVIKSTGGVAKVSADHVSDLAGSLMKKSGVDDEAIASGENLLLTFTNIRNEAGKGRDIFDQTTKAALDMSVALGTDVTTSSMQLGKALNDPVKGMTKLSKQGVTFTEGQKKAAEAMVKTGDVAGAQAIILKEVQKEFGGSAEAAGKTLPGMLNIARETFSNFAGELVAKAIPVLQQAIGWLRDHWPEINKQIQTLWTGVKPVLESLGQLVVSIATLIKDNWGTIGPIVENVVERIKIILQIIGGVIKVFAAVLRGDWSGAWDALKGIVENVFKLILNLLRQYALVGGLLVKAAKAIGTALLNAVLNGLEGLGAAVFGVIKGIGTTIAHNVATILGWGKDVAVGIKNGILNTLAGIGTAVWNIIDNIGGVIAGFAGRILGWGKAIGTGILNGIRSALGAIGGAVNKLTGGIAGDIGRAVASVINSLIDRVNSALEFTIHGPGPIPDIHINPPDIPHVALAKGGIISRPTMALLGEAGPELVLPLSGGGGLEVRVYIGDTELKGMVRAEVVGENNRVAQTLLAGAV